MRMLENMDVIIGKVDSPYSSDRSAPWRYAPVNEYSGTQPRYTFIYVWRGSYVNHSPSGNVRTIPTHSLVLFRGGTAPYYNEQGELPSFITNISFYTEKPLPIEMPENERFVFTPKPSWDVEGNFGRAIQLSMERPLGWKIKLREIAYHLLLCVLEEYYAVHAQKDMPALLRESTLLIRRNIFRTLLSVTDAAQLCHVTPTHLIRLFRRYMNTTPKKYMDDLRVERACELLKYTDKSMEEIAVESGFSEARQMRRVFHEHMGVSPKEYRGQI